MKKIFLFLLLVFKIDYVQATAIHKVQIYYGPSLFKYSLDSDQFNAQQPIAAGQAYAISYSYQDFESTTQHRFSLLKSNHNISVPASLSPSSIHTDQTKLNYKFIAAKENYNVGAGYSFYKVTADETAPNILLSSSESHAIDFYIERSVWHKSDLAVHIFADFELPFIKKELGTNTGFNQHSYNIQLGYVAKYLLNDVWSIAHKSEYSIESTSYDGQGNRGTLNAKEKSEKFQFLLGAGYDF
ncbi:MAG: hypothetical protein V4654_05725 [Bdellovibrionota bacterium]